MSQAMFSGINFRQTEWEPFFFFFSSSLSVDPRGDLFVAGTGIGQDGSAGLLFVVAAKTGSILGSHVIANRITSIRGGTQGSEYVASCWANGQLWAMNSGGLWAT